MTDCTEKVPDKLKRKERASNRMKQTYKLASIMKHLVLTQTLNGEWVLKLDKLSKEECNYIFQLYCHRL